MGDNMKLENKETRSVRERQGRRLKKLEKETIKGSNKTDK